MEWTKIKTKHFLHNDWTLEQKGCLATLLCLVAHLERIPTEKEMIQATHYKSLRSFQEKLKEQSITVQEVFKKVLIDVQGLAKNRVKTNERVNKHRASKEDVTRYSNEDVTHTEEKRREENILIPINPLVSEDDISKIITNWQKMRKDDFYINGKFSTGIVINRRKEIEGKTLDQIKLLLKTYNLNLNDDLTFTREYTEEEKRMIARGLCLD